MSHSGLCDGVGGSVGGVLHGDAVFLGILDVDVVNADTAADDQLQLAALCLVDVVGTNLGSAADDHAVEITQSCAQLLGSIELLHDLVTHFHQLGNALLIHTVGNKNTHICTSPFVIINR